MCLLLILIENESLFGEANSLNAKKLNLFELASKSFLYKIQK